METIIIGGGAAGLIAALKIKGHVTILEKNNDLGHKILVTGNGRCNYTNEDQDLGHYHTSNGEKLTEVINPCNWEMMIEEFRKLGIEPRIKNGYYYPFSNQALSIRDALVNGLKKRDVIVKLDTEVINITKDKNSYEIISDKGIFKADKLLITTGGLAMVKEYKMYDILSSLGLEVVLPKPALVQLKSKLGYEEEWAGIRAEVRLKHYEDNKLVRIEDGELQLTNYGISGICVMQLSSMIVEGLSKNREEVIQINFLNGLMIDESNIRNWLVNRDEELNENISSLLVGVLNDKLIKVLLKMIKIRDMKYRDLSLEDKSKLEEVLVSLKVKITGSKGFMNAQVTRGGVCLKEIDLKTMEVKKMKNLYLAGEVVDVDGDCGGYNLTWAFISGLKASKGINND